MSQDWLSRLRESDTGWDQPAFPDRFATERPHSRPPAPAVETSASAPVEEVVDYHTDEATPGPNRLLRVAAAAVLCALAVGWIAIVVASGSNSGLAARFADVINLIAVMAAPLALIAILCAMLLGRGADRDAAPAGHNAIQSRDIANQAAHAAARLGETHAQLMNQTRDFTSVAEQSSDAILGAIQSMANQTGQLEQSSGASIATLTALSDRISAMTDALPRLEDRLATLGETLARVGTDLGQRHDNMDQQLRATALVAEEARIQLIDAGKLLDGQLTGLRTGAKETGEELANLSELSSARIDLTLDRVSSALNATQQRIEAQNSALADLVEKSRREIEDTSGQSLSRFTDHCHKIETILNAMDQRIVGQADRSNAWLEDTVKGVNALANEFNALEKSAVMRTESLSSTMMQLSGDTKRLIDAVESGSGSSELLIKRAEALLLALDTGLRELDESMPAAISRVEAQIGAMHERIRSANPAIEAVEAVAKGVVSQMHESDQLAKAHVVAMTDVLQKSQNALVGQKQQIEALATTVAQASEGMTRFGESVGPQMVEALVRVRETADQAATRAREAIHSVIPAAAAKLGEASGAAVKDAVTTTVTEQLERLSLVADDAVKAAHRATDKLTRQMLSLTDASRDLERTLAGNAERIEGQDRDLMAQRSSQLIASLNERAIDVNKWLDKDVSEAEWTSYLKGDQGLFARRATRLVGGGEAKIVHALYNEDMDFREHVNRYVHDFEGLLKTVMASRDGGTLALTMVSSDIGKLYVALAQAIERLRSH